MSVGEGKLKKINRLANKKSEKRPHLKQEESQIPVKKVHSGLMS